MVTLNDLGILKSFFMMYPRKNWTLRMQPEKIYVVRKGLYSLVTLFLSSRKITANMIIETPATKLPVAVPEIIPEIMIDGAVRSIVWILRSW